MATRHRRTELVQAAYDLIAKSGLEHLRTRDVAGRAGVNIATLHYYFPTKEAIIAGVAQHLVQQFSGAYAASSSPGSASPGMRIQREFSAALVYLTERNDIVIVMQEMLLRARRDPAVARIVSPVLAAWRAGIERTVAAGIEAGEFGRQLDPAIASDLITCAITGALFANTDETNLAQIRTALEGWLAVRP
jgi:AcrR family transcriptional regulator